MHPPHSSAETSNATTNPGVRLMHVPNGFDKLRAWFQVVAVIVALVGAGYVALYRLGEVEKDLSGLETSLGNVKTSLGRLQLDVALICADTVRARGGDPMRECRTSRSNP